MSRAWLALLLGAALCGVQAQESTDAPAEAPAESPPEATPAESGTPAGEGTQAEQSAPAEQADAPPAETEPTIPVEPVTAEETAPPAEGESARLEDVVVTATKREASARELASSVSALSGEDLADMGAQDIEDIVTAVPGVNLVDERSGNLANAVKRITIRGIAAGQNQVDTVGVFIDETPFTDPFQPLSSADINPFDVGQVEVLKGPVGTLFGGSALNGAIRYLPEAPVLADWQGKAFAEWRTIKYGGDAPIFGAMVNAPLFGDDAALRIVALDRKTAGWVDSVNQSYQAEDVNGTDQQSVRAILRWVPLTGLDASLMYIHQDTLSEDYGVSTANRDGRYESTGSPQASPSRVAYDLWQLKGSYAFDWADLVVIASQAEKQLDAIFEQSGQVNPDPPSSVLYTVYDGTASPSSQEVRLVSAAGGDWDWLAGVFNSEYELDTFGAVTSGQGTLPPAIGSLPWPLPIADANGAVVGYTDLGGTVGELAAFGELSWRFAPDLQLTGGLRAYRFNYDVNVAFDGPICAATDPACGANGLHSDDRLVNEEQGLSPKLSLKWDFSNELMAYATVARGFRFGGVNPVSHPEIPLTYGSDTLWSYELGTRSEWLERTVIADLTAFYIDWSNAQFQTVTSDGLGFGFTDNVAAVVGRGVEGQFIWLTPVPGVKLTTTGAFARIVTAEDFVNGNPATPTTTPAGTRWPRAPKLQYTAILDWTDTFGPVLFSAGATYTHLGKALQNFGAQGNTEIFGYSLLGLQLTAKPLAQGWWPELAVNVNNLENVRGNNYSFDGAGGVGAPARTYNTPRNISARVTFNF